MDDRVRLNVFWKAIEALVTIAASLIQLACITRTYPPVEAGQYQVIHAWLFLISALACFAGIVMVATRDMSREAGPTRASIFSNAIALQIIIGLPLCFVCLYVFNKYAYFGPLAAPLSIGSITILVAMIFQLSQALLISEEKISPVVATSIMAQLVATVAIVVATRCHLSLTTLVTAWVAYHAVNAAALFGQTRAWRVLSWRLVSVKQMCHLMSEIIPVVIMVLATHLYVRIDVLMLDFFVGEQVVATYAAGYLFLDQLMLISNFMMSALFPNFARACLTCGGEYQRLYQGILKMFLKYLAPVALGIAVCSRAILGTIYGPEYAQAWPSLSVLMMAAIFAWLNGPSGTILLALKKQRLYMWATLASLLVNIIGNLILIPAIGAVGAAISTVLTEATICSCCFWWIYRETNYLPWKTAERETL
jgi:O-antigen/teichoic acid export membrane protein